MRALCLISGRLLIVVAQRHRVWYHQTSNAAFIFTLGGGAARADARAYRLRLRRRECPLSLSEYGRQVKGRVPLDINRFPEKLWYSSSCSRWKATLLSVQPCAPVRRSDLPAYRSLNHASPERSRLLDPVSCRSLLFFFKNASSNTCTSAADTMRAQLFQPRLLSNVALDRVGEQTLRTIHAEEYAPCQ